MISANIAPLLVILTVQYVTTSTLNLQNNILSNILSFEKESQMDFPEIVESYGYKSETHTVTTEDGYILKIFRILQADHCENKIPVLMGHGLLLAAESYIDAGPGHALAYLLSDACFDVWVANQRGSYHSRNHTFLNPDTDKKFWEFSYQEMGKYDQPAFINYILRKTGAKYLNYIGYSQSGPVFNIMCSERPEFNDKIGVSVLLAPASRLCNSRTAVGLLFLEASYILKPLIAITGTNEVFPRHSLSQDTLELLCATLNSVVCKSIVTIADSYHEGSVTERTYKVQSGHAPSGTSMQTLEHFRQALHSDKFLAFDHGEEKNRELYGTKHPPAFNLTAVTSNVVIMAGLSDHGVDIRDVKWLASQLPNVLELIVIDDEKWNHVDFGFSQYIPKVISPTVIKYLNQFS